MHQPELHRFVALLRGFNVGGHRRVPMADLRRALEVAGFAGVRTYLQGGNVGEQVAVGDRVVYLHLPNGFGRSKLAAAITERNLGMPVTARNWRTVLALLEMCASE